MRSVAHEVSLAEAGFQSRDLLHVRDFRSNLQGRTRYYMIYPQISYHIPNERDP